MTVPSSPRTGDDGQGPIVGAWERDEAEGLTLEVTCEHVTWPPHDRACGRWVWIHAGWRRWRWSGEGRPVVCPDHAPRR